MEYNAEYFGNLFVTVAKSEKARRSYKKGVSVGTGHIPYDTGRTQSSIRLSRVSESGCTIEIGNEEAYYDVYLQYAENIGKTSVTNKHKGFVQKFARSDFVAALEREFGKVTIL